MTINKKTVYRKDLISGKVYPRNELLRLVKIDNEILIDRDYSSKGRGAYIKIDGADLSALENGKLLSRAFKEEVKKEAIASLLERINEKR